MRKPYPVTSTEPTTMAGVEWSGMDLDVEALVFNLQMGANDE